MPSRTLPIHFLQRMLRMSERRGLDAQPVLRAAGIAPDLVGQRQARVTLDQMVALTRALWDATEDEMFGLGPPAPLGTTYLVALAAIHAPDLRGVLTRVSRASKVIGGVPPLRVDAGRDLTRIEMRMDRIDDAEHLLTELLLAMIHRFGSWMIGRRIALRAAEFPYPQPEHVAAYDVIFGCIPTFDADHAAVVFDSGLLTAPVVRTEDDLCRFLRDAPMAWYETRDYGSTPAEQVRSILERGLSGRWPTSAEIAARLTVSPQHLRRLLREQSTSISRIREEILRDAAIAALTRGEESVDELAVRLGFADAGGFRRAFRRWTGSPPGAYRSGSD
ncbi:AraC family transcriptional regulator [Nocardia nova]|uniref:AraC family transcriptional regulator n=1 Tax=Nocardia nova TaxID=37330 RepID=UPI0033D26F69